MLAQKKKRGKMNYKNGAFLEFAKASKDYFTMLSFLTVLIGGLSQFIELFSLSPSFVRFYSITQLISDGLAFFVFLFLLFTPWAIAISYLNLSREESKKNETTSNRWGDTIILTFIRRASLQNKKKHETVPVGWGKAIIFTVFIGLGLVCGLLWSKEFVDWNDFINPQSNNWSNFYKGYLIITPIGFIYLIWFVIGLITSIQELTKNNQWIKWLFKTPIVSILTMILYFLLFFAIVGTGIKFSPYSFRKLVTLKNEFLMPSDFLNSQELIQTITPQYPNRELKIEYFNDKYVFVKIGDKIKVLKNDSLIP
eukprot:m.160610 g.160610  ORF g.160610 m.160610 type:complete len:310 (-) comp11968_c0_seq1:1233-2162(-)